MSHHLEIEYEDDLLLSLGLSPGEFSTEARLLLAAKLYELGRISSGQGAQLCGMSRVQFLYELPRLGTPASNLTASDLDDELSFVRNG
jgi:predicted HTH domain antitoxin